MKLKSSKNIIQYHKIGEIYLIRDIEDYYPVLWP